uniref:Uncharacterized protein n=1 Tax=Oryza nivara TaxID=4536 RepID=A0A0E0FMS2_ORYNI
MIYLLLDSNILLMHNRDFYNIIFLLHNWEFFSNIFLMHNRDFYSSYNRDLYGKFLIEVRKFIFLHFYWR